ncbi:MAG: DUF2007 domain-containing protein [Prevotella sp.]|nr:DUF2007 domain-containing protein [Prevotella sp.]
MKLKRLTNCGNGFEASLLQRELENEGIPSTIKNEVTSAYPPMGGCVMFVYDYDYDKAVMVMTHLAGEA